LSKGIGIDKGNRISGKALTKETLNLGREKH